MGILALDNVRSKQMIESLKYKLPSPDTTVTCTIKCKLSAMIICDLEDPDLRIRVRHGIMKDVPRRKNKKRRIQKKWIKRYGMRQIVDYYEIMYRVISKEINFQYDTVEFECLPISSNKYTV